MEPYTGDIRMFAGNFSPRNYAFCNGQMTAISENEALYTLIGTTYGGDGQTSFALPDLRGRVPVHVGQRAGGNTNWVLGEKTGAELVTLTLPQVPQHIHSLMVSNNAADVASPTDAVIAAGKHYVDQDKANLTGNMSSSAMSSIGGSQPHDNMMPYLAINFIIALFGVFPQQN